MNIKSLALQAMEGKQSFEFAITHVIYGLRTRISN